jgi:hypothetical protein
MTKKSWVNIAHSCSGGRPIPPSSFVRALRHFEILLRHRILGAREGSWQIGFERFFVV